MACSYKARQPAYRAGPLSELISHFVHIAKSIPPTGMGFWKRDISQCSQNQGFYTPFCSSILINTQLDFEPSSDPSKSTSLFLSSSKKLLSYLYPQFWIKLCFLTHAQYTHFRLGKRAGVFTWENFHPARRDLGST